MAPCHRSFPHLCPTHSAAGRSNIRCLQVTELECRLQSSSSQLSGALEASTQHLERYRETKAEAAGLTQQLEQVRQVYCTALQWHQVAGLDSGVIVPV
jgi:hypothetical protein